MENIRKNNQTYDVKNDLIEITHFLSFSDSKQHYKFEEELGFSDII